MPYGEDPDPYQRNDEFLHRWRWFDGDYNYTTQATMKSSDPVTQGLRPFTGPLRIGELFDTNRVQDVRACKVRMAQQQGPAQQLKFNEYIARNAAREHWGKGSQLYKYQSHVINNWDSPAAEMPYVYKQ